MIDNDKAKDGWLKVFTPGLLYHALRDAFDSIVNRRADLGAQLFVRARLGDLQ